MKVNGNQNLFTHILQNIFFHLPQKKESNMGLERHEGEYYRVFIFGWTIPLNEDDDPLQWMGAVRKRVQTADKNITIIHK